MKLNEFLRRDAYKHIYLEIGKRKTKIDSVNINMITETVIYICVCVYAVSNGSTVCNEASDRLYSSIINKSTIVNCAVFATMSGRYSSGLRGLNNVSGCHLSGTLTLY